jgi:O-antigen ligase
LSEKLKVAPVARREWAVVYAGGLTLAFTAWGLSGVRLWSLHVLLAGALITFLLAILPLPQSWNGTDRQHGNLQNCKRLLQFPVFWLGLAFLAYLLIQGLNPAWIQVKGPDGWWLEALDPVDWLPGSVSASYRTTNAFRVLTSFGATFLLVCGLWVGLQRRACVMTVLWIFLVSSVGMAIVAILQKFTGANAILWTVPSPNGNFWGTFFYRNEAVAYLTWTITISGVLYFHHLQRSEQRAVSGGPHLLIFVFVVILYTSIALALSRGGIIFGGLMAGCFFCAVIVRWMQTSTMHKPLALIVLTALLLGGGSYTVFRYIDTEAIKKRFGDIEKTIEMMDRDSRMITTKVTWEMFQEKPWFGWGAGSWRYVFPSYQKNYPEIYYLRYDEERGWIGRKIYYYAHNDIVQFLCEYGIAGCSFLLLIFAYWIGFQWFRISGNTLSVWMLQIGIAVALSHAAVDFILQSPAYWLALNGTICVSVKLLFLDTKRYHRSGPGRAAE